MLVAQLEFLIVKCNIHFIKIDIEIIFYVLFTSFYSTEPIIPASLPNTAVCIFIFFLLLNNKFPATNSSFKSSNNTSEKYTKLPPIPIASGSNILTKLDIPIAKFSINSLFTLLIIL